MRDLRLASVRPIVWVIAVQCALAIGAAAWLMVSGDIPSMPKTGSGSDMSRGEVEAALVGTTLFFSAVWIWIAVGLLRQRRWGRPAALVLGLWDFGGGFLGLATRTLSAGKLTINLVLTIFSAAMLLLLFVDARPAWRAALIARTTSAIHSEPPVPVKVRGRVR
jgi:hypothetical protein